MSYRGPFTLVDEDGSEHEVTGSLVVEQDYGGLRSWRGRFECSSPFTGGQVRVRLPNGDEGTAIVTNMVFDSAAGMTGELAGSGPAPGHG